MEKPSRRLEEALEYIQTAVKAEPSNPYYLDSLGWVYFKLGKLEEAERYLIQALGGVNKSPTMYEHLGEVYFQRGKKELALQAWQTALTKVVDATQATRLKARIAEAGNGPKKQ